LLLVKVHPIHGLTMAQMTWAWSMGSREAYSACPFCLNLADRGLCWLVVVVVLSTDLTWKGCSLPPSALHRTPRTGNTTSIEQHLLACSCSCSCSCSACTSLLETRLSGAGKRTSTTDFISFLARFSLTMAPPAQRLLSPS
jgi:hypothetical protein